MPSTAKSIPATHTLDVAAATPRKVRTPPVKNPPAEVEGVETPGLLDYATICALEAGLKAIKDTYYSPLEADVLSHFVAEGAAAKQRPGNYTGKEGDATASIQLKARGANSELGPIEIALLAKHGIKTTTVGVAETIIINPVYADAPDLIRQVSKKLARLGLPADFFEIQKSTVKTVVDPASLDEVFKKPKNVIRDLLDVVAVVAVKPKVESVPNALARVKKLLAPPKADDKKKVANAA